MNLLEKAWAGFKAGALTAMVFPAQGGGSYGWGSTSDGWGRGGYGGSWAALSQGQRLDYRALVGDPSQSSVVMALCNWAGRNYPNAPLQAVSRAADGTETVLHDDPCIALMDRPNPVYGGALLWAAVIADCMLSGQGYVLKVRAATGNRPVQLWWVPSLLLTPVWPSDGSVWIDHYVYTPTTTRIRVEVADVIHLRPFGLDPAQPRLGRVPLAALFAEVWTDQEAQAYTGSILRNLAVPGCVIAPKDAAQRITQDDADRAKAQFEQRFGSDGRGRVFVASNPMDVIPLSFNPQQMDLASLRRLPEERVAAVYGIPAVVAGLGAGYDHAIYSNVEQAREAAYEEFLIPIQRINAHDLAIQLLPDFTTDPRVRLQHDYSHVRALQEDQDALAKRAVAAFQGGIMERGEAREMIGLEARPADAVYLLGSRTVLITPEATPEEVASSLPQPTITVAPGQHPALPPGQEPPALPPGPPAKGLKGSAPEAGIFTPEALAAAEQWADSLGLHDLLDAEPVTNGSMNGNGTH